MFRYAVQKVTQKVVAQYYRALLRKRLWAHTNLLFLSILSCSLFHNWGWGRQQETTRERAAWERERGGGERECVCVCVHSNMHETSLVPVTLEWWSACSCPRNPPPRCNLDKRQPNKPACWPDPAWCHEGRQFYCRQALCGSAHPCRSVPPSGFGRSLWKTFSWTKRRK